ncbi:MAG: cytochrome c-type biogenesis protein CcmH [Nitrospinota bacterium]|nr:cytochrome c-type biogenesis protein CcmH [Nitrospinota bacterium]
MKKIRIYMMIIAALVMLAAATHSWAASQMANLENALMCKCDDKCGKVLINCTCDTSKETRKTLMAKLESGLTVDQIIKQYVDKYGETILSAPTKKGFNLSAWITPFVALVIGGFGVRKVIQSWMRKAPAQNDSQAGEADEPQPETSSGKYSKKLHDELDRLES